MIYTKENTRKIIWLTLFSIGFGLMECVLVLYGRGIYFTDGFNFPIPMLDDIHFTSELFRELSTMIMLVSIAILSGKTNYEKFGWFLFCFGIWDIFYYIFLKAFINWPESLLTWDILFLIPTVWTGPVLAPVLSSIIMITIGLILAYYNQKSIVFINKKEWLFLSSGGFITFISYTWDYMKFLLNHFSILELIKKPKPLKVYDNYVPEKYLWWQFCLGTILILYSIYLIIKRNSKITKSE